MKLRTLLRAANLRITTITFAVLVAAVFPCFSAEGPPQLKKKMMQLFQQHPELMQEIKTSSHHVLAMGYRTTLLAFAKGMKKTAERSETVPALYARTAVDEMKRSLELMEKQHLDVWKNLPAEKKALLEDVPQLMHEHMVDVKARLEHLGELTKADRISSEDVINDLQYVLKHCKMGVQEMSGIDKRHCDQSLHHPAMEGEKAHDDQLHNLVRQMNQAPNQDKVTLMAEIITRMVEKSPKINTPMEHMHQHGKHSQMMPPPGHFKGANLDHTKMDQENMEEASDERD